MVQVLKKIGTRSAPLALAFGLACGSVGAVPAVAQEQQNAPGATATQVPSKSQAPTQTKSQNQAQPQSDAKAKPQGKLTSDSALTINPLLPLGVVGGLGGASLMLFGLYAMRRRYGYGVPALIAGGMMTAMLVNPEWITQTVEDVPSDVVVAVDQSYSQSFGDRAAMTEAVREKLMAQLGNLDGIHIRVVTVGGADAKDGAGQDSTEIFKAIRNMPDLSTENIGAVFVLSDGEIHDIPSLSLFGKDVPVHAFISGKPDEHDRVAELIVAPRFGIVGEDQTIRFKIDDKNAGNGAAADSVTKVPQSVTVAISRDGEPLKTLTVKTGEVVETKVPVSHVGANNIMIEAAPLPGEITDVNNRIITTVEGVREDLNVLVISGKVNKSAEPLRSFYKSDPDSNLVHFMLMRLPQDLVHNRAKRSEMALAPVPLNEIFKKALGKFDVVVFDHFEDFHVLPTPYLKGIADYAKNGGALLIVSGKEFAGRKSLMRTPLGPLIPVVPSGTVENKWFKPQLSETGTRHPVMRGMKDSGDEAGKGATWGDWSRVVDATPRDGAEVVMQTPDGKPLLVLDRLEKPKAAKPNTEAKTADAATGAAPEGINSQEGRVAVLLSDSFWQWARSADHGGPEQQLLRRLSHWLMKNPALDEEALRMTAGKDNSLVIERQTLSDKAPPPVMITAPDGKETQIELQPYKPGLWRAIVPVDGQGLFGVTEKDGDKTYSAHAKLGYDSTKELNNVVSTTALIAPLAAETGGMVMRMDGMKDLPQMRMVSPETATKVPMSGPDWMGIRSSDKTILRDWQKSPIIPGWVGALVIFGALAAAWAHGGKGRVLTEKLGGAGWPP